MPLSKLKYAVTTELHFVVELQVGLQRIFDFAAYYESGIELIVFVECYFVGFKFAFADKHCDRSISKD